MSSQQASGPGLSTSPILEAIERAVEVFQANPEALPQLQHTLLHARMAAEKLMAALEHSPQRQAYLGFQRFLGALEGLERAVVITPEALPRHLDDLRSVTAGVLTAIAPIQAEPTRLFRPTLTTPNYLKIELDLARFHSGEIQAEELRETLRSIQANMAGHLQANREEMEDLEGLTEAEQEFSQACLGDIDQALENSLRALERMQQFWVDENPAHLEAGLELLGPPTQQLIEAFLAMQQAMAVEDAD